MLNINYTKLFLGSGLKSQKNNGDYGYDVYMPYLDERMCEIFLNRGYVVKYSSKDLEFSDANLNTQPATRITKAKIYKNSKLIAKFNDGCWKIYSAINIPTGIALNLPEGIGAVIDNRSSNFNNNFNVVAGYIDNEYTYGIGVQLFPIEKSLLNILNIKPAVTINTGNRIAQVIFQTLLDTRLTVNSIENFDKSGTVQKKRNIRVGGFGSTGA